MLFHKVVIFIGTIVIIISFLFAFANRKAQCSVPAPKLFNIFPLPGFIPIYFMNSSLNSIKDGFLGYILFASTNIAIIIMHLLFIKGQLCIIRQHAT